jgi:hypothetical protein
MTLTRPAVIDGIKEIFNLPFNQALPATINLYLSFWNTLNTSTNIGRLTNLSDFSNGSNADLVVFNIIHNVNEKNYIISNQAIQISATSSRNGTFRYIGVGSESLITTTAYNSAISIIVLPSSITIPMPYSISLNNYAYRFRAVADEIRFKFDYV